MRQIETPKTCKIAIGSLMLIGLLMLASILAFSRGPKPETIEATAMGTGTQMGQAIGVTLDIFEFSTPEDRQILIQSFEKGQNQGLVNALSKMKAVGHCSITGTLGYDVSYIRMTNTSNREKNSFCNQSADPIRRSFF
jgi:hypothetical protein